MAAAPSFMRSTVALHKPSEKRIVAIGDSLIYGYGDPEGGGWVERLRRRWLQPETPGHAIYNLGVRGDSVQRVSLRIEQEFQTRGEFRNRVPDLIMLSVGTNDSSRVGKPTGRLFTPRDAFEVQVKDLLDKAVSLCPVIFVGMTPVVEAHMPFAEILYYGHWDQYQYKEVIKRECRQRGIPYLDIFDLWLSRGESWWRSRISSDGLHPNVLGYQSLLEDVTAWQPFREMV